MKTIFSIVLCAAAVSAFGDDATLGTVGVTEISSNLKNTIVAVSYDDLADGPGIVVSNFVKTTNLDAGDQLAVFSNGKYETWTLDEPVKGGPKFWKKNDTKFLVDATGKLNAESGTEASLVSSSVGTGIWLCRATQPAESFTFYIYGKPVSSPTSTTVAGAWTLVGNPTQAAIDLSTVTVDGVATGDQIVAIDENGMPQYYFYKSGKDKEGQVKGWRMNDDTGPVRLPAIGAGLGVWIRTASKATIHWNVPLVPES